MRAELNVLKNSGCCCISVGSKSVYDFLFNSLQLK